MTTRSRSILKGMVHSGQSVASSKSQRSDSLPNKCNTPTSSNSNHVRPRAKSVMVTPLSKIGLPEDTFDRTIIMTDKKKFRRRVEQLIKNLDIPKSDGMVDLRKLNKQLSKDFRHLHLVYVNRHFNIQPTEQAGIARRSSEDADDEVDKIINKRTAGGGGSFSQYNSLSNLTSATHIFRSSSALNSRIPTPQRTLGAERPKSKMELRIQRRQSCSTAPLRPIVPDSVDSGDKQRSLRKYSVDDEVVQFQEYF